MTKDTKELHAMVATGESILRVFGVLLFGWLFLVVGMAYGIRAGLIVALEKTLELLKEWGQD